MYETSVDATENLRKFVDGIQGKSVKVGCLTGEHRWLAGIHEFGCKITAKKAKYLTVPIHPKARGKKAGEIPELFCFTAKSGEKFLAKGEGDDIEFYYWLTKSVKIPERSFLRAGHDKYVDEVLKKADKAANSVIEGKMSVEEYLDLIGQMLSTKIKEYAVNLSAPPNGNATTLAKGSSNPLVDTGSMIEGITWKVE